MIRRCTALLLALASATALAHSPVCVCKQQAADVICEGGFADGSGAANTRIDVIGYDETVLITGKLDKQSRFTFTRPAGPFYVLMDVGPGEMFEVDWTDIE